MSKKKKGKVVKMKQSEEKPVDYSDDNDIAERDEDGGNRSCDWCSDLFYITEGYSDEYCSRECFEKASNPEE